MRITGGYAPRAPRAWAESASRKQTGCTRLLRAPPGATPESSSKSHLSTKMKYTAAALLASGASAFTTSGNALPAATRPQAAAQAPTMAVAGGINGFGRIGRLVARIMAKSDAIDLKLVNSGAANEYMAYQFKYDSIHGRYPGTIEPTADGLMIDGVLTPTTHTRDPSEIPFSAMGAEYICESTGAFLTAEKVEAHLAAGAKKIIFSAPAKDDSPTVVMGVNEETYDSAMKAVSCASCTTNGLAPMVKALNDAYGIDEGLMTTVHAMTATRKVVDASSNKDWRGGRCASGNIIPSSTGIAFRVPTADVSVVDLTVKLNTATSYDDICAEVSRLADGPMTGILGYCDEPLVSTDFETEPTSSVFDAGAGIMLSPKFVSASPGTTTSGATRTASSTSCVTWPPSTPRSPCRCPLRALPPSTRESPRAPRCNRRRR